MYFWIVVVLTLHTLAFLNDIGNFKQLKKTVAISKVLPPLVMASLNCTFLRILAYCVYIVLHLAGFVIYYCIPLYCYQNALKIEMGCLARNLQKNFTEQEIIYHIFYWPENWHLSATSYVFHPNMLHPLFYILSISSLILHFSHFLPCLFIPWIVNIPTQLAKIPFHPHLKCKLFHPWNLQDLALTKY